MKNEGDSSMKDSMIVSGYGGQGVLLIGQIIAYAAVEVGLEVCWLPSYSTEMRGGTANCSVIVSQEPIASPVVISPSLLIAMNQPSVDKYYSKIAPNGVLLFNGTDFNVNHPRDDVTVFCIPAAEMAEQVGNLRGINMVFIGAYSALNEGLSKDSVHRILDQMFSGDKQVYAESNKQLVTMGYNFMQEVISQKRGAYRE
jgi:2-oxoglutarate ferredoxin oxidoreductase subunit gamma